jgi:hypothetical protein
MVFFLNISFLHASFFHHTSSAGPSSVASVLGKVRNHLKPDMGSTVDSATLKSPGVELHRLLLHLCEAWLCRIEELFHFLF